MIKHIYFEPVIKEIVFDKKQVCVFVKKIYKICNKQIKHGKFRKRSRP